MQHEQFSVPVYCCHNIMLARKRELHQTEFCHIILYIFQFHPLPNLTHTKAPALLPCSKAAAAAAKKRAEEQSNDFDTNTLTPRVSFDVDFAGTEAFPR
jgi:hypothetical protein